MIIRYTFTMDDGVVFSIPVDLNRKKNADELARAPEWTKLEYHKCPNCPLSKDEVPHCPVAVDISSIVSIFAAIRSYDMCKVEVETEARTYSSRTDAQTALQSLFGLLMGSSTCPVLSQFRPMALQHLPFATFEETLIRTAGNYLIRQYIKAQKTGEGDFNLDGLEKLYEEVGVVNKALKDRVQSAESFDVNINAINSFFSLSRVVSMSITEQLADISMFYDPHS